LGFLFKVFGYSRDGSAGADTDYEMRDLSFCLFPDFRPGLFVMRDGIGGVIVLVHVPGVWCFFGESFGN
jgi:hypothetical protein